jgi:hypothetical protein
MADNSWLYELANEENILQEGVGELQLKHNGTNYRSVMKYILELANLIIDCDYLELIIMCVLTVIIAQLSFVVSILTVAVGSESNRHFS